MGETDVRLSRRRFALVSSAAVAAPFAARSMAAAPTAEAQQEFGIVPKGTRVYYIGEGCVGCQACRTFCLAKAIRFGDCGNEIDQKKCQHCGTCYQECNNSAISETVIS
jgi:ferredoxin